MCPKSRQHASRALAIKQALHFINPIPELLSVICFDAEDFNTVGFLKFWLPAMTFTASAPWFIPWDVFLRQPHLVSHDPQPK